MGVYTDMSVCVYVCVYTSVLCPIPFHSSHEQTYEVGNRECNPRERQGSSKDDSRLRVAAAPQAQDEGEPSPAGGKSPRREWNQ